MSSEQTSEREILSQMSEISNGLIHEGTMSMISSSLKETKREREKERGKDALNLQVSQRNSGNY